MKLMAFGDVHLGTYDMPLRHHILNAMSEIVGIAVQEKPDYILFTGDAFRHRHPAASDVAEFGNFLYALSRTAPVIAIAGNHDTTHAATTIDVYARYNNIAILSEPFVYEIGEGRKKLFVHAVPWLPQKRLIGGGSTYAATELVLEMLKPKDDGYVHIMLAHCTALGARFNEMASTMIGGDVAWPQSWFNGYDAAFLGHIHHHQQVAPFAWYTGSPCGVSFNEVEQRKYVLIWRDGDTRAVQLQSAPTFLQVHIDNLDRLDHRVDFLRILKPHGAPDPETIPPCGWHKIDTLPPEGERRVRLGEQDAAAMLPVDALKAWLALEGIDPTAVLDMAATLLEEEWKSQ
jgi:exonuclease SbcD